ncbi:unnamed protein product [Moneuplotes crassus]|uniref:Uncharacterized protein n=1 Tax=Euplotes crassus TaxID=5936 RepID=A0AAD1XGD0_EUPCR|nr:unnamed protein product [Moneuplotes crassus]
METLAVEDRSRYVKFEKSVRQELNSMNDEIWRNLYYHTHSQELNKPSTNCVGDTEISASSQTIGFFLENEQDVNLVKIYKPQILLDVDTLNLFDITKSDRKISEFLSQLSQLNRGGVFLASSLGLSGTFSYYFSKIIRIGSRVQRCAGFYEFYITSRQFKRLMSAYKHLCYLSFDRCKLEIPKIPDFSKSMMNAKLQNLLVFGCGESEASGWENDPSEFDNLIEGLATSPDLRLCLVEIFVEDTIKDKSNVEEIIQRSKFAKLNI